MSDDPHAAIGVDIKKPTNLPAARKEINRLADIILKIELSADIENMGATLAGHRGETVTGEDIKELYEFERKVVKDDDQDEAMEQLGQMIQQNLSDTEISDYYLNLVEQYENDSTVEEAREVIYNNEN